MARYRVLAKSFINNSIEEEGAIVEYDGEPADNLELIEDDKPRKARKSAAGPVASEDQEQAGE